MNCAIFASKSKCTSAHPNKAGIQENPEDCITFSKIQIGHPALSR
jgi:hypothetical protein